MVRVMTEGGDNWLAVAGNQQKGRKNLVQMPRILSQEGAYTKVSGKFFKVVVQSEFLFGEDTWVLTLCMEQSLSSFQTRVMQQLTGRQPRRR